MTKRRKIFDELMGGVDAMRKQREDKMTLRTHEVEELRPESPWGGPQKLPGSGVSPRPRSTSDLWEEARPVMSGWVPPPRIQSSCLLDPATVPA
jgi:hypothetical protein